MKKCFLYTCFILLYGLSSNAFADRTITDLTALPDDASVYSYHAVSFEGINTEDSDINDLSIGEAQLFMNVTLVDYSDAMTNDIALFQFINNGPEGSSITDIYFDDDTVAGNLDPATMNSGYVFNDTIIIDNSNVGVTFSQGATPASLPGGKEAAPEFVPEFQFSLDSDSPIQPNGINPGESLTIEFEIAAAVTTEEIASKLMDGSLRVGLKVQGFDSGGSEAFINNPVPEPGTLALFGLGLIGLSFWGRRKITC